MLNPISSFHNYLKNEPTDGTFIKSMVLIPIVGTIIQIWKTFIIHAEIRNGSIPLPDILGLSSYDPLQDLQWHAIKGCLVDFTCVFIALSQYNKSPLIDLFGKCCALSAVCRFLVRTN